MAQIYEQHIHHIMSSSMQYIAIDDRRSKTGFSIAGEAWYLIQCKPRQEQRALDNLELQQFEVFFPTVAVERLKRGKRQVCTEALFPSYLFVHFNPQVNSASTIRSTRGVARLVQFGDTLRPAPTALVDLLKQRNTDSEGKEARLISQNLPSKGDKVEIHEGSFKGITAIYHEPDGEKRAILLIKLIGQPVSVSMDNRDFSRN